MGAITRGIANNILGNGAVDGTDALTGTIPATNIGNPSLANLTTFPPSVDAGIPQVAGDPPAPSDGDVWYNTNTYKLKVRGVSAALGSWATGGNLNTVRRFTGGVGTQTAALSFGGSIPPSTAVTESYDGTSWTEVADLNAGRQEQGSAGTQTAALSIGGDPDTAAVEEWNNTSWTEIADLNTARRNAGVGLVPAALAIGGYGGGSPKALVESWNGSSWTEVNDLNTARYGNAAFGTQTSALTFGGDPVRSETESWNGTSWTEVNNLNTGRLYLAAGGTDNTSGLAFGGYSGSSTGNTEEWNGTSWAETSNLNTARNGISGDGTTAAAIGFGGGTNPPTTVTGATEEWNAGADNLDVDLA